MRARMTWVGVGSGALPPLAVPRLAPVLAPVQALVQALAQALVQALVQALAQAQVQVLGQEPVMAPVPLRWAGRAIVHLDRNLLHIQPAVKRRRTGR